MKKVKINAYNSSGICEIAEIPLEKVSSDKDIFTSKIYDCIYSLIDGKYGIHEFDRDISKLIQEENKKGNHSFAKLVGPMIDKEARLMHERGINLVNMSSTLISSRFSI